MIVDYDSVADDRDSGRWVPLRVSCRVTTPILYYGDGLNLDGMLAFGAYQSLTKSEQEALPPINQPWACDFDMPIAKWACEIAVDDAQVDERLLTPDGKVWGWCTSDVQCEWEGRQAYDVRKMPDTDAMRRLTSKKVVNTANGRYKGSNLRYNAWWPEDGELVWYALGEAEGVGRLLRHVPNIGKLHNHGFGKIECNLEGVPKWHIEEIDHDRSIEGESGRLNRSMPEGYQGRVGGTVKPIRAPRHHRSRYILCVGGA